MIKFTPVFKIDDLPPGKRRKVDIGDEEILIANVKGEIYAVSDRCGHMGASLSVGEFVNSEIECPLHGTIFDMQTGKVVTEESRKNYLRKFRKDINELLSVLGVPPVKTKALKTYPVEVKDGVISVGIEEGDKCEKCDCLPAQAGGK